MALIGNYSLLNRSPKIHFGGGIQALFSGVDNPEGTWKNRHFGGYAAKSATPNGYVHGGAYVLPRVSGGLSSYVNSEGVIAKTNAEMFAGRNLEATASSVITLTNAQLDQVIAMIASGALTISVTDAGLSAAVDASVNGSMSFTVSSAQLGGIFDVTADGTIILSPNVTMTALANMIAEAGGPTPLSPEGLANAVWDTVLADHQITGSTGKALSDAGGAGNPWSADLATNNTAGTFGALVQKLLTVAKFLGLR
jgi:hypothetical protein